MMELIVKGNNYKVKFGYNSFCDTDLMDRTSDLLRIFQKAEIEDDSDVAGMGMIKELFCCVRELLYVGFQKHNPVESVQEVGNIIDDYHEESTEDDKRGLLDLFTKISSELMNEGFLGEVLNQMNTEQKVQKTKTKTK